jgi:hypothetical protein
MKQITREQARTVRCPTCDASPGHRCVEYRTTGHHRQRIGAVQESNHEARVNAARKPADHFYEPLDRHAQDETLRTIIKLTRDALAKAGPP